MPELQQGPNGPEQQDRKGRTDLLYGATCGWFWVQMDPEDFAQWSGKQAPLQGRKQ